MVTKPPSDLAAFCTNMVISRPSSDGKEQVIEDDATGVTRDMSPVSVNCPLAGGTGVGDGDGGGLPDPPVSPPQAASATAPTTASTAATRLAIARDTSL